MWVFFQYTPTRGDVLDVTRMNENFLAVSQMFAGGFGEHAWARDTIDAVTDTKVDIAIRHMQRAKETNPWSSFGFSTHYTMLDQTTNWTPVDDVDFQRTFTSRGGEVEVIISCNTLVSLLPASVTPGLSFAIAVDGSVMHETIIGGADESADEIRYAPSFSFGGPGTAIIPNTGGYGPAIRGDRQGIMLSWRGRLPPGRHTVGLFYRNISSSDGGASPQGVGAGELNIWEYWS